MRAIKTLLLCVVVVALLLFAWDLYDYYVNNQDLRLFVFFKPW